MESSGWMIKFGINAAIGLCGQSLITVFPDNT